MKTATRYNRRRWLGFENLERRMMLTHAGFPHPTFDSSAVFIAIADGELRITGEHFDNHIRIDGFGIDGEVLITSTDTILVYQDQDVGDALFVGGLPDEQFDRIVIDLREGNDTVEINNVQTGSLSIDTGAGADVVRLGAFEAYAESLTSAVESSDEVNLTGGLSINTGPGADLIQLVRLFTGGGWSIGLGDGDGTTNNTDGRLENDFPTSLDDQLYIFVGEGNAIHIAAGSGDDLVNINYLVSNGALSIDGGLGNDVLSVNGCAFKADVGLFGGSGFDTVAVDFSRHDAGASARLTLDGGVDGDFMFLARSLIREGQVGINAGAGFDHVVVGRYYANVCGDLTTGGNEIGRLTVNTESGNDRVDIRGNVTAEFFGLFGEGDDDVDFINNVVRIQGLLDGGLGFDTLTFLGNLASNFGSTGFENMDSLFSLDREVGPLRITSGVSATLQFGAGSTTPFNILLAEAHAGCGQYTFFVQAGSGTPPPGMQLVTEGNKLFLRGIPSASSGQFTIGVQDQHGDVVFINTPISYSVGGTTPSPTVNTTGVWSGPFTQSNPLGTQSGTMTLNLTANPAFTTVVTGTITLTTPGFSGTRNIVGTVSGVNFVFNIPPAPGFILHQLTGTVSQTTMNGNIVLIDSGGGQTTGTFTLSRP